MKKAQGAMEFLMTYGWAILVVLLVISSLAYFGVLNPARFLPERFIIGPELTVTDYTIGVSDINVATRIWLQNNLDDVIDITAIEYPAINCVAEDKNLFACPSTLVKPGERTRIDFSQKRRICIYRIP